MKNFTLTTLFILSFLIQNSILIAQERTASKTYSWEQQSKLLTNATGWAFNEGLDEWIEYENFISKRKDQPVSSLGYKYISTFWDCKNFNSLQFKTITYEDEVYYCLFNKKNEGKYKYPNIKKDWEHYETTIVQIYTAEEYNKLLNITEDVNFIEPMRAFRIEWFETLSDSDAIKKIHGLIKEGKKGTPSKLHFKQYKDVVRFITPTADYEKFDFENNYFETPLENFNKLTVFE